jgi:hypothetical protein
VKGTFAIGYRCYFLTFAKTHNTISCFYLVPLQFCGIFIGTHRMTQNGKFGKFVWDEHAMTGFEDNVQVFSLLAIGCVLINVS